MSLFVSDEIVKASGLSEDELLLEIVVLLFKLDKISLGKAAELLKMPQIRFQRLIADRGICVHYDVAEFQDYVYVYSKSEQFLKDVEKRSLTNATPQKINMGDVGNVPILISLNQKEQQSIATVLSDMDAEIAALESRLAKTQAIKQGMMQEILTGRTRLG